MGLCIDMRVQSGHRLLSGGLVYYFVSSLRRKVILDDARLRVLILICAFAELITRT